VQNKFRRISSERQLRRWEEQLERTIREKNNSGRNRIEKLFCISKFTHDKFITAVESRFIVHDIDFQRWALQVLKKKFKSYI